ncbi:MAG: class II aldolase/adducin family protein [Pseudomonadota bacterium]|nr:class II aldolase/adducin family protein [Pseudomonadota bacterium]
MGPQAISNPKEGVIQYQLEFEIDHDIDCPQFAALNGWRSYLHRLGLIGQAPDRYDGLGYGNVSHRAGQDAFVISGTQTGHLPLLCREHYVLVEDTNVQDNYLRARGPIPPSSEALTHAALYLASDAIQAVIHVHSPLLWQRAPQLQLATTPEQVSYGTPAMAEAVTRLVTEGEGSEGVIAMLGHEDGIIVYGADVEAAGARLLQAVMEAHQFDEHYFK